MVVEIRRYLGNTLSVHVHDADHEHPNCHLGRISSENRLWYDTSRKPGQTWATTTAPGALGGSDDRRSVGATSSMTLEL